MTFTIAGVTQTAVTDAAGLAATTFDVADHGRSQSIDVAYAGSPYHGPSSTTATLTWSR